LHQIPYTFKSFSIFSLKGVKYLFLFLTSFVFFFLKWEEKGNFVNMSCLFYLKLLIGYRVFAVCHLICSILDINLLDYAFSLLICRNWVISCSLSRFWCQNYCLWRWLHGVVILCWRSFYIVWFVDMFELCFSWLYCWTTSWLIVLILLRLIADLCNCSFGF